MQQSANSTSNHFSVRAIAQAGNAVAIFAIVLLFVNSSLLFTATVPDPPIISGTQRAPRALLVVVDGLRADAVTPQRMPRLYKLGQSGIHLTSGVHALIPSTIAGIRALAEGVVVPPAEFVHDFRSRRAPSGGLLEAVHVNGGRVFAAGPYLWRDLYGQWITGHLGTFGLVRDDPMILRASRAAAADPQWQLVIAHFSRTDVMAHLHGATSRQYEESLAWCDRAIADLAQAAGPGTLIVVTSDHGVTRAGGHAGTEPDVLTTPLVANASSFASGQPGPLAQSQVPHNIAAALGVHLPVHPAGDGSPGALSRIMLALGFALLASFALRMLLGSATLCPPPHNAAFWLNASVWTCLFLAWLTPWAASVAALLLLLALGWRFRARLHDGITAGIIFGLILGIVRILVPWITSGNTASALPSGLVIGSVCLIAFGVGYTAGRRIIRPTSNRPLLWLGAGMIALAPVFSGFLGESVSLSTLDVRLAFRLIESPAGLAGAVVLGALRPFLPILFLLAGLLYYWRRQREPDTSLAILATGASATVAGELVVAALTLASSPSQPLAALGLGLLLRECALVAVLFPTLAGSSVLLRRERGHCDKPESIRGRTFHPA